MEYLLIIPALAVLLLLYRRVKRKTRDRADTYVCNVCNERDCICEKEADDSSP